jgi:hypothetical protein
MIRELIVPALLLVGLGGCAPNRVPPDAFKQITPGLDRLEVERRLGSVAGTPWGPNSLAGEDVPANAEWVRWSDSWSWEARWLDVAFHQGHVVWRASGADVPNPKLTSAVVSVLSALLVGVLLFVRDAIRRQITRLKAGMARRSPRPPDR